MNDEEYLAAQQALILAGNLLALHDWTEFANRINRAETMGVFMMAPFAYQQAASRTRELSAMASRAQELVRALGRLKELVEC